MGFFERLTKPSPQAQELIDLQRKQLEAQAAEIREGIRRQSDARKAAIDQHYGARMASTEAKIAAQQRERADIGKRAILNSQCFRLMTGLSSPLESALVSRSSDFREAMRAIRSGIEQHTEALKAAPTIANLEAFQAWALDQVSDEGRKEAVRAEFQKFVERLSTDGIVLG